MTVDRAALKRRVCAEIDRRRDDIFAIGDDIWRHPELGFKEHRTAGVAAEALRSLGLKPKEGIAITGVKAVASGAKPGPGVAVLGELDALGVPDHPECDPTTGAVHACGHNAQIAGMVGVAMGIVGSGVLEALAGRVVFIAVPAEEYVEVEYRNTLRQQGKLEFLGGKPEFIRLGEMDDVDIAMMTHLSSDPSDGKVGVPVSSNGCIAKQIQYVGRAAHAGGAPHRGINALAAANIALAAINAQRETFRDEDCIRVHPIITRGGDIVNVIPADVRLETYVRGKTVEAIQEADRKVERALRAGAIALGAVAKVTTLPGYLPQVNDSNLADLIGANADALHGPGSYRRVGHRGGSTDMGDVEHIMPAVHPHHFGGGGTGHGRDYHIADREAAYLGPAKMMAMTVVDLLCDDAATGKDVIAKHKPLMTKEQYLAFMRSLFRETVYTE